MPGRFAPLSEDGRVGLISFDYDVDTAADLKPATHEALLDAMDDSA